MGLNFHLFKSGSERRTLHHMAMSIVGTALLVLDLLHDTVGRLNLERKSDGLASPSLAKHLLPASFEKKKLTLEVASRLVLNVVEEESVAILEQLAGQNQRLFGSMLPPLAHTIVGKVECRQEYCTQRSSNDDEKDGKSLGLH